MRKTVLNNSLKTAICAAIIVLLGFGLFSYAGDSGSKHGQEAASAGRHPAPADVAVAMFAGGCFWCMEPPFDVLDGVISTISGYSGGHQQNPSYEQVSAGGTGHAEVVQISYDPAKVSYEQLLQVFWRNIDPTTPDRQFCDRGHQYRSAIFYQDKEQERLAKMSKAALDEKRPFEAPIVTEILPATMFYPAEDYHQDYYVKNPRRYKFYRYRCGRDARLMELWGSQG